MNLIWLLLSAGARVPAARADAPNFIRGPESGRPVAPSYGKWNFTEPLRVCYVSLLDFSSRCNGSPNATWEGALQPVGAVPREGWCSPGEDFCGYDVDVWECASSVQRSLFSTRSFVCFSTPGSGHAPLQSPRACCLHQHMLCHTV